MLHQYQHWTDPCFGSEMQLVGLLLKALYHHWMPLECKSRSPEEAALAVSFKFLIWMCLQCQHMPTRVSGLCVMENSLH